MSSVVREPLVCLYTWPVAGCVSVEIVDLPDLDLGGKIQ